MHQTSFSGEFVVNEVEIAIYSFLNIFESKPNIKHVKITQQSTNIGCTVYLNDV